jgi:hypothetical protein
VADGVRQHQTAQPENSEYIHWPDLGDDVANLNLAPTRVGGTAPCKLGSPVSFQLWRHP